MIVTFGANSDGRCEALGVDIERSEAVTPWIALALMDRAEADALARYITLETIDPVGDDPIFGLPDPAA